MNDYFLDFSGISIKSLSIIGNICCFDRSQVAFSSSLSPQKSKRVRGSSPILHAADSSTKTSTSANMKKEMQEDGSMMAYSSQREPIVITDSPSPAPSVITISDDSDGETMETSNKR